MGLWDALNKPAFAAPAKAKAPAANSEGVVIGNSTVAAHIETAKTTILDGAEKLLGVFHGQPLRDGKAVAGLAAHHYLLITDKRVIFWGRGLGSNSTDAFAHRDISSVDAHQGLLMGDIVLNVKGAKEKFQSIPKMDVHVAAKLIRVLMEQSQAPGAVPSANSIPDQIKKLAELRDVGVLTEAEFQAIRYSENMAPTPTKREILKTLNDHSVQLKELGVKRMGLFGSFVRDEQTPESDIDLLVQFEPDKKSFDNFMELSSRLENLLERHVELVTTEGLSPYIGPHIMNEVEYASLSA
jgi:predicted nucleotidyltransferase